PEDYPLLLAHETGHVVDQASGERFSLGMKGMSPEEIARMAETRASGQGLSPQEIARLIETRYSRTLEGLPPEERELIIRQARRIYNDRNMHPDNPRMVMQKRTGVPVKEE
ncbi:hypothetical protein, partial [Sinorhizobium meliloti]